MKKITVTNFEESMNKRAMFPKDSETVFVGPEEMDASDGYHTFTELYDHRITLAITLVKVIFQSWQPPFNDVWRSKLHSDGSSFEGWYLLGIHKAPGKQITYHIPLSRWDETNFVETLEKAPEWDGHTKYDVLERLKNL